MDRIIKKLNYYNEVIRLNPNNSVAFCNRGNLFNYYLNQHDNALSDYNEAIRLNPNFSETFYNRGNLFNYYLNKYDNALSDYNDAIRLNSNFSEAYYGRGSLYANKLNHFDKALNDYNDAIRLNSNFSEAYYGRGNLYANKLYNYEKALSDYNEAIRLNPDFSEAILYRGILFNFLERKNEAYIDFNKYIYLRIFQNKEIESISILIRFYESKPQIIKTIFDSLNIDNSDFLFNNKEASLLIHDYNLILYYCEKIYDKQKFYSLKSILYYYLGDSVTSFKIFDEILDDDEYVLSSQELYYYSIIAQEVNVDDDTILENNIRKIESKKEKKPLDYYYLAHLYLLQENKKYAIKFFEESNEFIFSSIMLSYLLGDQTEYADYMRILDGDDIFNSIQNIDYKRMNLLQFHSFFHIKECLNYIALCDEIEENIFVNEKYHKSIWEIFQLSSDDKIEIEDEIRKLNIEPIIKKIKQEFTDILNFEIDNKKEFFTERIYLFLKERDRDIRNTLQHLEKALEESPDPENQLGLDIEKLSIRNNPVSPKFYLYLIQYYYLIGTINSEETFTLYFYLIHIGKRRKKIKDELFYVLGENIAMYIGIPLFYSMSKFVWTVLSNIIDQYDEFYFSEDHISDFKIFKENLWRYISSDKESLSPEKFEKKYNSFKWFGDKNQPQTFEEFD